MYERAAPAHTFGITSTAVAILGKVIQSFGVDVTGIQSVDFFIKNNLDSIFGMVMYAYIFDLIADKNVSASKLAGYSALVTMVREVGVDPLDHGNGIDYVDLFGGIGASGTYYAVAAVQAKK